MINLPTDILGPTAIRNISRGTLINRALLSSAIKTLSLKGPLKTKPPYHNQTNHLLMTKTTYEKAETGHGL